MPPPRNLVDTNVGKFPGQFQALDANTVFVLDNNDNLWLEHSPWKAGGAAPQQIDGNVLAFQILASQ